MLQCKDCEFFHREPETGRITLKCDPFSTIKEPACLEKMQLLRLDALTQMYQGMMRWYQQLGPMQKQMFDMMKREMEDYDESESWKYNEADPDYVDSDEDAAGENGQEKL